MTIQQDWLAYCSKILSPMASDLTEDDLSLLRHTFFCGANTTYRACYYADLNGDSAIVALNAILAEIELFNHERPDIYVRVH